MKTEENEEVRPCNHIQRPHDIHLVSVDEVNGDSKDKWTTFTIDDDDHVVNMAITIIQSDYQIRMYLHADPTTVELDDEIKDRIRKGFQFLKAIFGISVVLPSVGSTGVMPIVAAWRSLKVISELSDELRDSMSIPASIVVNTAELLGRYNCLDGRKFVEGLLDMFPLISSDQASVRASSFTDYGKIVKH